jgi:hypothetical protein
LAPIPAVPLPPSRPGSPAALPVDPPPWRPGLRADLVELAADAANRAWELASGLSAEAGLTLDPDADLARRAARTLGTPTFATLAARSGMPPRDLARQALAWRQGGLAGLELLRAEWDPAMEDPDTVGLLEMAQAALRAKTGAADVVRGNRITAGRLQLRLGRDLRWYPYARSDQDWEPSGPAQADPALAVVYGVGTSVAYALFILILRGRGSGETGRVAGPLFEVSAVCAVVCVVAGPISGGISLVPTWPGHGWLALLALTSQVAGWMLITWAWRLLPAAQASLLLLIQPIASVALSAAVLERMFGSFHAAFFVAAAMYLLGAVLWLIIDPAKIVIRAKDPHDP